jgi:hypothetical protein
MKYLASKLTHLSPFTFLPHYPLPPHFYDISCDSFEEEEGQMKTSQHTPHHSTLQVESNPQAEHTREHHQHHHHTTSASHSKLNDSNSTSNNHTIYQSNKQTHYQSKTNTLSDSRDVNKQWKQLMINAALCTVTSENTNSAETSSAPSVEISLVDGVMTSTTATSESESEHQFTSPTSYTDPTSTDVHQLVLVHYNQISHPIPAYLYVYQQPIQHPLYPQQILPAWTAMGLLVQTNLSTSEKLIASTSTCQTKFVEGVFKGWMTGSLWSIYTGHALYQQRKLNQKLAQNSIPTTPHALYSNLHGNNSNNMSNTVKTPTLQSEVSHKRRTDRLEN